VGTEDGAGKERPAYEQANETESRAELPLRRWGIRTPTKVIQPSDISASPFLRVVYRCAHESLSQLLFIAKWVLEHNRPLGVSGAKLLNPNRPGEIETSANWVESIQITASYRFWTKVF
jgi:hypothetical protein